MIGSKFPICQAFERSFSILPDMAGSSSSSPSRADAENARIRRILSSNLYFDVSSAKAPVVYSSSYDIAFMGIEKLHPFDSSKWGRICQFLISEGILDKDRIVEPLEASREDLLVVHSETYLDSLKSSLTVATIIEVPPVALLPNCLVQQKVLRPFRRQVGGTILAAKLAKERGWAINVGGGFHHCSANKGGGFCAYADISLCIHYAFSRLNLSRVMIIDLDAHQGNGHEIDFSSDGRVYILDMYNAGIYPFDYEARRYIHQRVELSSGTKTEEYLELLERALAVARNKFDPELVVYNAGTDILDGDSLGQLKVSPDGVKLRDEMVFRFARDKNSPVVMLTSGGYMKSSARVVANSIINLTAKGLVKMSGVPLCDPSL
ncbi:histone deacetylase 2 isoform X1 [Wolffia australiana]